MPATIQTNAAERCPARDRVITTRWQVWILENAPTVRPPFARLTKDVADDEMKELPSASARREVRGINNDNTARKKG